MIDKECILFYTGGMNVLNEKEIMIAINLQLYESGKISENMYKKAESRIKKGGF